jgi:electron transport complex protein RnfG
MRHILNAWLVIVISLAFGGALAATHLLVKDRIEEHVLNEALGQVQVLVPGAASGEKIELDRLTVYKAYGADKAQLGWVLPATGRGFVENITVLVGLDLAAERITGLYVLEQRETPGLGTKIKDDKWRSQFVGKDAVKPLKVVRGKTSGADDEILAITGATISSRAICDAVTRDVAAFRAQLAQAKPGN